MTRQKWCIVQPEISDAGNGAGKHLQKERLYQCDPLHDHPDAD